MLCNRKSHPHTHGTRANLVVCRQDKSRVARSVAAPCHGSCQSIHADQHSRWLAEAEVMRGMQTVAAHGSVEASGGRARSTILSREMPTISSSTGVQARGPMAWNARQAERPPGGLDHHCHRLRRRLARQPAVDDAARGGRPARCLSKPGRLVHVARRSSSGRRRQQKPWWRPPAAAAGTCVAAVGSDVESCDWPIHAQSSHVLTVTCNGRMPKSFPRRF